MNIPTKLGLGALLAVGTGLGSMAAHDHFHGKGGAIVGPGTLLGLGVGGTIAGSAFAEFARGGTGTLGSTALHGLPAALTGLGVVGAGIGAMYLWNHLQHGGGSAANDAHDGERIMAPGPIDRGLHIGDGVYRPGEDPGGISAEPYTGGGSVVML
jgi:hypothetical protein